MQRRQLILLLSGTGLAGLAAVSAQQPARLRRIGAVMLYPENDPQGQLRAKAFQGQLEKAGWKVGDTLQIDFQWGTGDAAWVDAAAERALRLSPDLLLANGDASVRSAMSLTKTVPVIFIGSGDPVEDGLVQSLARPGGNVTGFAVMEPSLGAKLLGMLKQIAPRLSRVAVLFSAVLTESISGMPAGAARALKSPSPRALAAVASCCSGRISRAASARATSHTSSTAITPRPAIASQASPTRW